VESIYLAKHRTKILTEVDRETWRYLNQYSNSNEILSQFSMHFNVLRS